MSITLKQLKFFLAVANTGRTTRAAEILHTVQPAISKQIQLLEKFLGCILFERTPQGMTLTESGQSLVAYAQRIVSELDRARAEIEHKASNDISGIVRLGLLPSTVDIIAGSFISELRTRFHKVQAHLSVGYAGALARWLRSGDVDAALLYSVREFSDFEVIPLVQEPLWIVGTKDIWHEAQYSTHLGDLAKCPLILPSTHHGIRILVDEACAIRKLTMNIVAETNALSVQRAVVLGGQALTILPPIAVADDLEVGRLVGAPLENPQIHRTIVLAKSEMYPTKHYVRIAIDLLMEEMYKSISQGKWPGSKWIG